MDRQIQRRLKQISVEEFKTKLQAKTIRLATLNDVDGTNHKRPLYKHPNTGAYYTEVKK